MKITLLTYLKISFSAILCILNLNLNHAQTIVNGNFSANSNNCSGPLHWLTNNVQIAEIYQQGNNWIDMTGCASGNGFWIEQDIPVTIGTTYYFKMDLGSWFGWDDEDAGMFVTIDGVQLGPRYFNDSFTGSLAMKLHWETITTCAFVAQKSTVTLRITGHGLCTKNSPPRACSNPNPGVMALDNVTIHSISVNTPSSICALNGNAKLFYTHNGIQGAFTREWFYNGVSLSTDSVFQVNKDGIYTLKLSNGCIVIERQIRVNGMKINEVNVNLCKNGSVLIKGKIIRTDMDILDTLQAGICDSIVMYKVRFHENSNLQGEIKHFICETNSDSFIAIAPPNMQYKWIPGGETTQSITIHQDGFYFVELIDSNGCSGKIRYEIVNTCSPKAFVPNAFSPNGDGKNDVFLPNVLGINEFRLRIFNRWGEMLFDSFDTLSGWDGYYKGQLCQESVYLYLLSYSTLNSNVEWQENGTFTLLR